MGHQFVRTVLLLGALVASACTISPAMERARPARSLCPDEALRRDQVSPADTAGLRWYRAEEERDVRLGSAWCSTVGAPALEMRPRGGFPAWEADTDLDIVTWNTAVGGGDIFAFLDQELGLDCSGSSPMMAPGSRPFVLMLQEVWRRSDDLPRVLAGDSVPWTLGPDLSNDALDIVETAERCGLSYLYVPSSRNGPDDDRRPREDRGNAILTTLRFSAPIALDLPHEGGRKVDVGLTSNSPGGERVRFVSPLRCCVDATAHRDHRKPDAGSSSARLERRDRRGGGRRTVDGCRARRWRLQYVGRQRVDTSDHAARLSGFAGVGRPRHARLISSGPHLFSPPSVYAVRAGGL